MHTSTANNEISMLFPVGWPSITTTTTTTTTRNFHVKIWYISMQIFWHFSISNNKDNNFAMLDSCAWTKRKLVYFWRTSSFQTLHLYLLTTFIRLMPVNNLSQLFVVSGWNIWFNSSLFTLFFDQPLDESCLFKKRKINVEDKLESSEIA